MDSLNRMALELVEEAIDFTDELGIEVRELDNEATLLDFGHHVPGGIEAGLLLAEIQTAGLATVQTRMDTVAGAPLPHVELTTDRPSLALLCSQTADWELSGHEFEGLGSGPARALAAEAEIFTRVGYADEFDFGVLAVESGEPPTPAIAADIAERAGIEPSSLFLATVPTASLAGSLTVAARAAELATVRLTDLGYDPLDVRSVSASAPLAPVSESEASAMGQTNDALAYGGQVHLTVAEEFDRFDELPSTAADEYGTPFESIFASVDWSVADLPAELFAPAQLTVDVVGGSTHVLGETNDELLADSFDL
ncbi:methenyltetrahydromethanopterin cyclohydrolase [Halococcus qingdaonensis]|uniref:methenyltetrahydromethanopterin cyclohydrolase n=1 Tax=Halococcus qingdaonensis TaxID=224402 RepID=UPI002116C8B8|nr:methenyltetrahydromethanopterin cyclohydrolase [Halococcus qingdaonensis]